MSLPGRAAPDHPPEKAPDKPTYVELEFEQGAPVKLDGAALIPLRWLRN